jgi:hypothetical protein
MSEEKESFYLFNNAIRDLMCDRCGREVQKKCYNQNGALNRTASMIECMKTILEPNDEKYPIKFRKAV